MQFDISLELCRARIQQLADYENEGLIEGCSQRMKEYLYSYCLWLRSMYSIGSAVNGYKFLATSISTANGVGGMKKLMDDTVSFANSSRNDWLVLWNVHAFQYVNPELWTEYQRLSKIWFEASNTPT